MAQFLKRFLVLSSFCTLLIISCRISKYKHLTHLSSLNNLTKQSVISIVKSEGKSIKYTTTLDFFNKHFSGLLVIKQTDSITKHLVFITELGIKLFDFEIKNSVLRIAYIFEPLNNPKLLQLLTTNLINSFLINAYTTPTEKFSTKKDEFIFALNTPKQKQYLRTQKNGVLLQQELFHNNKRYSNINYTYSESLQTYTYILCKQYGFFNFKIELNAITTN